MSFEKAVKVAILDYGIGNLFSVKRACEYVGMDCEITANRHDIERSSAVILPGVGAFGDAMDNLRRLDLIQAVKDFVQSGKPFLGICLGMQLLMEESTEFGNHEGLGVLKGRIEKFPLMNGKSERIKVPQIGWNKICFNPRMEKRGSILDRVNDGEYMYFVHSYYVIPGESRCVITTTNYSGIDYCSGLQKDNIFAFQFHPEKSGLRGIEIYRNFKEIMNKVVQI